jgi:hypothetical protein
MGRISKTAALENAAVEASTLRKEKADLEDEKLRLATTVEDKVGDAVRETRARIQKEFESTLVLKLSEKDKQIAEAKNLAEAAVKIDIAAKESALKEAEKLLQTRTEALTKANEATVSLRKQKSELEDEKARLSLTIEESLEKAVEAAKKESKAQFEADLRKKLAAKDDEIATAKAEVASVVEEQARRRQAELEKTVRKQAQELEGAKADLLRRDEELTKSKEIEAEFLKAKRQLDEEKRQLPLTIQQKVEEELTESRKAIRTEVEKDLGRVHTI